MADMPPDLQPGGFLAFLSDGLDLPPLVNGVAPAGGPLALTQNQLAYESQPLWGAGGTDEGAGQDCEEEEEDDTGPALATAKNSKKRKREANYTMEEMTTIIRLRCASDIEARIANKMVRRRGTGARRAGGCTAPLTPPAPARCSTRPTRLTTWCTSASSARFRARSAPRSRSSPSLTP